jgi:hypothetical protein
MGGKSEIPTLPIMRLLISLLVLGTFAPIALADESTQPTTAPYMHAAQIVRALSEGPDSKLIDTDAPLDDHTAKFLSQNQRLFDLLHEAATGDLPQWCNASDDMETRLHQLNPMRSLAQLGILRTRFLLKQGQPGQAVDQLMDVLALGRNLDRSNALMVSSLVSIGVESSAIKELATDLPALPRDVVATLADRLKQLPAPMKFSDLIAGEQQFGGALLAQQLNAPQAAKAFDAMSPFYDALKKACDESPPISADKFKQKMTDAVSTIDKDQTVSRALAQNMVPSFAAFYSAWCTREAQRQILEAGVAVVRDGPDAIKASADPFGDGPFDFSTTPGGFELKSKLLNRSGDPVSMRFGK